MSETPPTAIHRMVERCRADEYPALVAKLESGWVIMGERQVLAGYCLLLPDPVVAHLNVLTGARRARFLEDMALTGDAVQIARGRRASTTRCSATSSRPCTHTSSHAAATSPMRCARPSPGRSIGTRLRRTRMPHTAS